jgi:hypothetical protein
MTRPDLAFTYSQLSKFVQSPGPVHLAAAERALAYLRGTYNEGITYRDPAEERSNKLTGWVEAALKPSLWQRHRRAKKPSICERCCGVSISDKSAPQKYGKIMPLVL